MRRSIAALSFLGLLSACSWLPGNNAIDRDRMDAALDARIGGDNTCVVIDDVKSGAVVYQYGANDVCGARLPPCATREVPLALAGLDAGVITPQTVYRWDGSPQSVGAWQTDADITKAFNNSIDWWWDDLGRAIGPDRLATMLGRFGYGGGFLLGLQSSPSPVLSTRDQAAFFRRFYGNVLHLTPSTSQFVQALLVDEVREDSKLGKATLSAVGGSCTVTTTSAESVAWLAGSLQTPVRDLAFAATVAGAAPPPGVEVRQKIKDAFADAGLWPLD